MLDYNDILGIPPFEYDRTQKEKLLTKRLCDLTRMHLDKCESYKKIADALKVDIENISSYYDLPFVPVSLFKNLELKSIPDGEIFKTMTSSGTTGQKVSKIYLDKTTASNQQKTLTKIVSEFTGAARLPMIIIDCPSVIKDRKMFSARGAGILGFSMFGTKKIYALDDDMKLNIDELRKFTEEHRGMPILLFGFTFMIWQYFYKELLRPGNELDLSNGVLIHGGGWKKLSGQAVSKDEFRRSLKNACGISKIHDYYGMVEQTGCIYMECECGHLHASIFSDVITRRMKDFSVCDFGEKGVVQVLSMLPESYPGHSILTEDEGIILGEDDCPCGRNGKYFEITGRIMNAEVRGCSDTYESK